MLGSDKAQRCHLATGLKGQGRTFERIIDVAEDANDVPGSGQTGQEFGQRADRAEFIALMRTAADLQQR